MRQKNSQTIRLKYAVQLRGERVEGQGDSRPYIGLEHIESGTGRLTTPTWDNDEESNELLTGGDSLCNLFEPSDVLFGKLRPYLAKTWVATFAGRCTTELLVMIPKEYDSRYLKYTFLSAHFLDAVNASTFGVKMPRADWDSIGNQYLYFPSFSNQQEIANYLDRETAHIDKLIKAKEDMLSLLSEKRQALITQVISRGLSPSIPLKTSGADWLGNVPKHWVLTKLKYVTKKIGSGITPKGGADVYQKKGIPLLRSQNIHFSGLDFSDVAFITEEVHLSMLNSRVELGDVLLNITGASLGRCYYYEGQYKEANVNQHVCIIRPNESILTKYLFNFMFSRLGQIQIEMSQTGGGREGLNFESLKAFVLPLPPAKEQEEIVKFVDKETEIFNKLHHSTRHSILLLKERRSALITAAVTGQLSEIKTNENSSANPF